MAEMTLEAHRRGIEEVVRRISERQYQLEAWFGSGKCISSPEEMYCELFDDCRFSEFLDGARLILTPRQLAAGSALKQAMESFPLPDLPDPRAVIDDAGWQKVRCAAKDFLAVLSEE